MPSLWFQGFLIHGHSNMPSPVIIPFSPFLFPREFAKEKDRVESRAAFLHKKMVQRLDLEIDGYMNWICKAGKKERGNNFEKGERRKGAADT